MDYLDDAHVALRNFYKWKKVTEEKSKSEKEI